MAARALSSVQVRAGLQQKSWAFGQGIEKYDVTKVFGPLYTTETIQGSMNAVSANSKYKAEALKGSSADEHRCEVP